jgi:hypothetical protein
MDKQKTQINLLSLKDYIGDKDFRKMDKQEQLEICQRIREDLFPKSQNTSLKTQKK